MQFFSGFVQGTWWGHGHLPRHRSHKGGSDSGWYCHFPVHLSWTLGEIRYNMFPGKVAAGVIKPETLPPTKGAVAQHALRAYLQTRDWILLQSMSLDPSDYGWTLGVHGYEPVPTPDPMAPEGLLKFTSCNCHGDCSNWRSKKNGVMCISACEVCKGITCKNSSHDVVESEEDRQWLLKLLALGMRH